jgi:hypothetical protein
MEKISIFNYEAFYLDYLEGNLNDEDKALLLHFLEKHPELKLDNDDLPVLEIDSTYLDDRFKTDLKQIMFNETVITFENVEQFLIAQTEGLLSSEKQNELEAFIADNLSLRRSFALYAATRIKPDYSIVYADKDGLKRSKRIVFWPYISFAAAAAVISFIVVFMPNNNRSLNNLEGPGLAVRDSLNKTEQKKSDKKQIKAQDEPQLPVDDVFVLGKTFATIDKAKEPKVIPFKENQHDQPKSIDQIKFRSPKAFELANLDQDIIETKRTNPSERSTETRTSVYAQLGFQDMNNPIKPVTSRIGDLVNQEVDFRTAKATQSNSGGFYLKIGKFELSHKKH